MQEDAFSFLQEEEDEEAVEEKDGPGLDADGAWEDAVDDFERNRKASKADKASKVGEDPARKRQKLRESAAVAPVAPALAPDAPAAAAFAERKRAIQKAKEGGGVEGEPTWRAYQNGNQ